MGYLPRIVRFPLYHIKACEQLADPSNMESRHEFSESMAAARDRAIVAWYAEGGYLFVKWVKKYYRRWQGDPLDFDRDPFVEEMLLAIGNPWFDDLTCEKAAQVGWTEYVISYTAFCSSTIKIPVGFGVELASKLQDLVGPRVQRAFDNIGPIQQLRQVTQNQTGRKDIDAKTRILTVGGVPITFFYAGVEAKSIKKSTPVGERREVAPNLSSFIAQTIIGDEFDAWAKGAQQTAKERTSSSTLPTIPLRWGSTPGGESGLVASTVKKSKYLFEWQVKCSKCKKLQALYPLGSLLLPVMAVDEEGQEEERFLDESGRPLKWRCSDDSSLEASIKTAYIGCRHCGAKIQQKAIQAIAKGGTGHYRCSNTKVKLTALHDRSVSTRTAYSIAIRIPRLASPRFNAEARIRACVESDNPIDALQQGLGIAASVTGGGIGSKRLMDCVGLPVPPEFQDCETLIVMGVDQGQRWHWGIIVKWYIPEGSDRKERWRNAFKQVIAYRKIYRFEGIVELAKEFDVDVIGIDVDPETEKATDLAEEHSPSKNIKPMVFAFNQVYLKAGKMRKTNMAVQGKEVSVYSLHRTWGLDALRTRILRKQQSFPAGLSIDMGNESSWLFHYITSKRLPEGIWTKPESSPDHALHADNFTETGLWAWLFEERKPKLAFTRITK
jgi:hypothetical protein